MSDAQWFELLSHDDQWRAGVVFESVLDLRPDVTLAQLRSWWTRRRAE